jgi:hypothetical protein
MKIRGLGGELALCLVFMGTGAFWVAVALGLPLWEGFAPATGLLPLVYGALLIGLAVSATFVDVLGADPDAEARQPVGRAVTILLALAAGVLGIETAGFFASMAAAMLFLFAFVEKRPVVPSLLAATGTSLLLTLVFRTWLGVPLPSGPWGF